MSTRRIATTHFASKANAKTPAASGAAAEVPEWLLVHFPYKSVVACESTHKNRHGINISSHYPL